MLPSDRTADARGLRFPFDLEMARLPERFYARVALEPVAAPRLITFNRRLADELGLEVTDADEATLARVFSGSATLAGAEPIALAYAGHQFGQFVPQLGDGRALLIGEVLDRGGARRDLQLKGSGPTPWSRDGDGRAALGPVLREYLVSEGMHALGVPTTRALAAVLTGEVVFRERRLPGAVLTRVAASHVRVGSFQYFAARGDLDAVRRLADLVIGRHYPALRDHEDRYLELLGAVIERQAGLVARWMCIGFVHGVMNTDNTAVSGETLDYGPCAFLDGYDPATVFSSIDSFGRYAYVNQPAAAQWNLARFAESLLGLIDESPARAVERATPLVSGFAGLFEAGRLEGMRAKLGLTSAEEADAALVADWLELLHTHEADFTLSFRRLCDLASPAEAIRPTGRLWDSPATRAWEARWRARFGRDPKPAAERVLAMRARNPLCIPRNHRIEEVIEAAVAGGDFAPFHRMLEAVTHPFEARTGCEHYAEAPRPEERVLRTFCGT
jgi:uncharacterized protein YdiU (UPF0061 family)